MEFPCVSGRSFYKSESNKCNVKPGLNRVEKKEKCANASFKYGPRFIKRNENTIRSDSLARKLQNNNYNEFCKELES